MMKKWIIILTLILVAGGIFAFRSGWLDISRSSSGADILSYVPADTAFYIGGNSVDKLAELMNGYPLLPSSPSQEALWKDLTDSNAQTPKAKFFAYLVNEYRAFSNGSVGAFAKFTGISFSGAYAAFSDGLIPVVRMKLTSAKAFDTQLEKAVADSQWQYTWENIGDIKARTWKLTDDSEDIQLSLAVAHHKGSIVITLVTSADNDDDKKRRLGLAKPELSLANGSAVNAKSDLSIHNLTILDISAIKKRYGYTSDMLALLQFDQIAQAILAPEKNRLGRDLLKYLPRDTFETYQAKISASCRTEYAQFVAQMPRLVMGYQNMDFQERSMAYVMHSALEIKNSEVLAELKKMQGHLPTHSKQSLGKIMSFGLGLNTETLPPALLTLWTQFTEAEFACEHLRSAQQKIKAANPAILGMPMAMAEGVKGLGLSVFDVTMNKNISMPSAADFLLSVSAESPVVLMNMARVVPFLKNINLPDDGSAVSIQLPMVPSSIDVKAAVKGKHVAIFAGAKSESLAEKLSSEDIATNGLYSAGFDYRKLGELMTSEQLQTLGPKSGGDVAACIQQQEVAHMLQFYQTDIDMTVTMEDEGIVTYYRGSMDKLEGVAPVLSGEFTVEVMNEACTWESIGFDTLKSDGSSDQSLGESDITGTGRYIEKSFDDRCELFQSVYSWRRAGSTLELSDSGQSRDTCSEAFSAPEQRTAVCHLINVSSDSFQCLYDPATANATLYRYRLI